jgi:hypothetical protein
MVLTTRLPEHGSREPTATPTALSITGPAKVCAYKVLYVQYSCVRTYVRIPHTSNRNIRPNLTPYTVEDLTINAT